MDNWSNKPLELEHAVATAGGNRAVSPRRYSPGYNPLIDGVEPVEASNTPMLASPTILDRLGASRYARSALGATHDRTA